jgi:hypothetical protein
MNSSMTVGKQITPIGAFLLFLTLILGVASLIGLSSLVKTAHSLTDDSLAGVSSYKVEFNLMEMRGDMWRRVASRALGHSLNALKSAVGRPMPKTSAAPSVMAGAKSAHNEFRMENNFGKCSRTPA